MFRHHISHPDDVLFTVLLLCAYHLTYVMSSRTSLATAASPGGSLLESVLEALHSQGARTLKANASSGVMI